MRVGTPGTTPIAAELLAVEVVQRGLLASIRFSGDLCTVSVWDWQAHLLGLLEDPSIELVELDLSAVRFIDARGVTLLLDLRSTACGRCGFSVTATSPAVDHLLEICGLEEILGADSIRPPRCRERNDVDDETTKGDNP